MAQEKKGSNYLSLALTSLITVIIFKFFWPATIPFAFFEFWRTDGLWLAALKTSWPLFAWGSGLTLFSSIISRNDPKANRNAEDILIAGILVSIWAGVVEEICFRWLIFYGQIAGYKVFNWITFGLFSWFFTNVTGPLADFFTLGYLHPILYGSYGWAIGSAIISSNGKFRDGHIYQGIFGFINSWFIGIFFFYMMFAYGLPAAILVHFLYDLFIFIIRYLDAVTERWLGWD